MPSFEPIHINIFIFETAKHNVTCMKPAHLGSFHMFYILYAGLKYNPAPLVHCEI